MESINIKKVLLSITLAILSSFSSYGQQPLWVGQSYKFDVSSYIMGITTNMSWSTNGGYLSLSGSGLYRNITVTQYFSGTATVTCEWDYKLTSNGSYTHTKRQITISCRDNQVSISPTSMTMSPGETRYVSYRHQYDNQYTSAANAYFQSTNPSVARVNERTGEVYAVSSGNAYIYVYSKVSSISPYCLVSVKKVDPTSISIPNNLIMTAGESKTITPTIYPANAQTSFSWTSSNTEVATISSSGYIQAKKHGTATITVYTSNGLSASCNLTVNKSKLNIHASLEEGLYPINQSLELHSDVEGSAIYYTLDGTTPTTESHLYTNAFNINSDFTLKAVAVHPDYISSDILTQDYKVTGLSVTEMFPSNNEEVVCDIHLPYIEYNKDLSNNINKSSIYLMVDDNPLEFTTSVIDKRLYFIPKDIDDYRGNHRCSIHIDPYSVISNDGDPTLPIDFSWKLNSFNNYYESYPTEIYASTYASAYIDNKGRLNTWGGWPTNGGCYYNMTFSYDNVKKSCTGEKIFAYIDNENNLWVAGVDSYFFPEQKTPILYDTNVIDVAYAKESTLFFVKESGELYGVGSDRFKQLLGKGNKKTITPIGETIYYADVPIKLMDNVKSVISNDRNCAVIKKDHSLWMWGVYDYLSSGIELLSQPRKISDDVKQASIGDERPVTFIKNDNTGWYVDNKTLAIKKIGENIALVEGSKIHGFYITTDNKLYGWGRNDHGQIGIGSTSSSYTLPENAEFVMEDIIQVSHDWDYTLALTTEKEIYGWGRNYCKRFDQSKSTDYNQTTPKLLFTAKFNPNISGIVAPTQFSIPMNEYCYIPIRIEPINGVFYEIEWSSTDENIASVDCNGVIYTKAMGDCEIHITVQPFEGSEIKRTIELHVDEPHNTAIMENIADEEMQYTDVYNMQGIKVLHNATMNSINNLLPGIYIKQQGNCSEKIIIR